MACIKNQLIEAVGHHHDVQLHLHPQWKDARKTRSGTWELDLSLWRSPDLPVEDFKTILQQGKIWLEKLIKPHSPDYRCLAFRAGGWCIQPSEYIIKALLEINFLVDSSVAPGQHCQTVGEHYDFRNAPQRPYWRMWIYHFGVARICL